MKSTTSPKFILLVVVALLCTNKDYTKKKDIPTCKRLYNTITLHTFLFHKLEQKSEMWNIVLIYRFIPPACNLFEEQFYETFYLKKKVHTFNQ